MDICRACLSSNTHEPMVALDETLIDSYNLLTNLNVALLDGLSQLICQKCLVMINLFIEFRKKSVKAELKLREQVEKLQQVKWEVTISKESEEFDECLNILQEDLITKTEIKIEETIDEEFPEETILMNDDEIRDLDPLINNHNVEETKKYGISKEKRKSGRTNQPKSASLLTCGIKKEQTPKTARKCKETKQSQAHVATDSSLLACGLCKETINKTEKDALKTHLETHKDDAHCQLCPELFASWPDIVSHRFNHLPIEDRRCHICSKRFQKPPYFEFHFRKIHCKEENVRMTCKLCNKNYPTPRRLQKHHKGSHSDKRYICDVCSKAFNSKGHLAIHVKLHIDAKPFSCSSCEFSCKLRNNLNRHIIRKHTATKLICKQCKRAFMDQAKIDKHKCPAPCICPVCGQSTPDSSQLKRHMRKHSDEKPYRCTLCVAAYRTQQSLATHRDSKHGGERRHRCQYCPRAFYSLTVLIKHRLTHTGEKPYVCPECHKGFTANHNLKVHMKVHGIHNLIVKRVKSEDEATDLKNT